MQPDIQKPPSHVVILKPGWRTDPWTALEASDHPSRWTRCVLVVVPDPPEASGTLNAVLGTWLAQHVPKRRNTVRFLLPSRQSKGIYDDQALIHWPVARC